MNLKTIARRMLVRRRGDLLNVMFSDGDGGWHSALVPDDCVLGLCRELILQSIYTLEVPLPAGGVVIDGGAHVGVYSLLASRAATVVSLEADPVNFRTLELNVSRNEACTIKPLYGALWTSSGEVRFARTDFTEGGMVDDAGITTPAFGLDDLIDEYGPIACLKIDIEGAEFEVLPAAARLAEVETIVGELHFSDQAACDQLVRHLERSGFNVALIDEDALSHPRHVLRVLRNWRRIRGRTTFKLAAMAYFVTAGRFGASRSISRSMPLFVARRQTSASNGF